MSHSKGPIKVIIHNEHNERESTKGEVDLSDLLGVAPASRPKRKPKSKRKSSIRSLQRHQSPAERRRSSVLQAKKAVAKRRRLSAKARRSKLRSKKRHDNDEDHDMFEQKLFGCFKNPSICILSLVLPCYVQGKIAYKVDRSCLLYCFLCVVPFVNIICRVKVRKLVRIKSDIYGSTAEDCLAVMCCPCSLSQEAFELDALLEPRNNSMDRE